MLGYAKSANVPAAGLAAALPVLATIARRRLVQLPPGFHRLWGVPLLSGPASPAALDFAAAAITSGQGDAAIDAASWQPEVLSWLQGAPPAAAPSSVAAVVAALLNLPEEAASNSSSSGTASGYLAQQPGSPPGGPPGGGSGGGGIAGGSAVVAGSEDVAPSLGVLGPAGDADSWWHWWQEDAHLSAQLAGVVRGGLLRAGCAKAGGWGWGQGWRAQLLG